MRIVKAEIMIQNPGQVIQQLTNIEYGARISHRSEEAMKQDSWNRFIKSVVLDHGDWSVVEHANATVIARMDRGISHEWVRHRLMSFTQESTRFVNYEKKMPPSFIYPIPGIYCESCERDDMHPDDNCPYDGTWKQAIWNAEAAYRDLIHRGWPPQDARSVFPNALATKMMTTANLRSWRHILLMRTTKEAHPQIKCLAIDLLNQFKQIVPLLFDDIEPGVTQISNMRKPH